MLATTRIFNVFRIPARPGVYLIDTNIISEIRKGKRTNRGVRAFFTQAAADAVRFTCPS